MKNPFAHVVPLYGIMLYRFSHNNNNLYCNIGSFIISDFLLTNAGFSTSEKICKSTFQVTKNRDFDQYFLNLIDNKQVFIAHYSPNFESFSFGKEDNSRYHSQSVSH